jgi:hypothetical protein
MIDTELKDSMLKSIMTSGQTEEISIQVNTNISDILNLSSGSARLQSSVVRKAKLILSKPLNLHSLSSLQIRCCLCHKIINYPCWYYEVKYAVNHFHYFICFQPSADNTKPNTFCMRRA